jgi:CheY-like chemotaxis protein
VADKAKVLLVDDREENLVALEAILSSLDQPLVSARSGEAALSALRDDRYAVILLDVIMPGMDGFETAARIKQCARTRDIPIIFLTGVNADSDFAFRGYAVGAVDYIIKPFDPWVLRAKVSVFVELYAKNMQLRTQAELLRAQLGGAACGTGQVMAELSGRLGAVEDQLAVLSGQRALIKDSVVADSVSRLEQRIGRLRDVFDALSPRY